MNKQNFISVDGKTAKNSYDVYFTIGEIVSHQDTTVGTATILSFELDERYNEINALTDKGHAHIDFLNKI